MAKPIDKTLRPKRGNTVGFERWSMLGHRLVETVDPDGVDIPKEWMDSALLAQDFPKIPANVWNSTVALYVHFMESPETAELIKGQTSYDTGVEVAVFYTKNLATGEIRVWVPSQAISRASVEIDYERPIMDLMSGERIETGVVGLPDDVVKIGTSHSHNTMWAGFSGTDDANELGQPGLHIVAGKFAERSDDDKTWWYHEIAPSVVMGGKRYRKVLAVDPENPGSLLQRDMVFRDIIDYDSELDVVWDRGVLNLIEMDTASFKIESKFQMGTGYIHRGTHHSYSGYVAGAGHGNAHQDCEVANCNGFSTYSGYCWQCGNYDVDKDDRVANTITMESTAKPLYNGEGEIMGYRVKDRGTLKYEYSRDHIFKRLVVRFDWPDEDAPWKNVTKTQRKRIERYNEKREQRRGQASLSSHSKIDDEKVLGIVLASLDGAGVVVSDTRQERIVEYELKEFAKIIMLMRDAKDPEGLLVDALARVWNRVTGGIAWTKDDYEEFSASIGQYGLDMEELNSQ